VCLPGDFDDVLLDLDDVSDALVVGRVYESFIGVRFESGSRSRDKDRA
jgi:hypothetical protein